MKYIEYNPATAKNCVIRSFSLLTGENCETIEEKLKNEALMLGKKEYTDVEVFENYLEKTIGFGKIPFDPDKTIKDLELSNGTYCVFCYDKNNFYHMVVIHNDTLYDKTDKTLDLYPLAVYKSKKLWINHLDTTIKSYRVNLSRIPGVDNFGTKYIIPANNEFNFPFLLFVPDSLEDNSDLLVGVQTVDCSRDTFDNAINEIINFDWQKRQDTINGTNIRLSQEFNSAILVPVIPRTKGCDATYLGYELLDTNYDNENEFKDAKSAISKKLTKFTAEDFKKFINLDGQVLKMINYSKNFIRAKENKIVNDKVILNGYSATSHFVNYFSAKHPTECLMVIGGGCGGRLIIPKDEVNGEKLTYPVGVSNINFNLEEFAKIHHFYYLGSEDKSMGPATPKFEVAIDYIDDNGIVHYKKDKFNNVVPALNSDGTIKYLLDVDGNYQVLYHDGYYSKEQINIINRISQDSHELFDFIEKIYKDSGITCVFNRKYEGDHWSVISNSELINDIIAYYKAIKGNNLDRLKK